MKIKLLSLLQEKGTQTEMLTKIMLNQVATFIEADSQMFPQRVKTRSYDQTPSTNRRVRQLKQHTPQSKSVVMRENYTQRRLDHSYVLNQSVMEVIPRKIITSYNQQRKRLTSVLPSLF